MTTWIIGGNGMLGSEISRLFCIDSEKMFEHRIDWNGSQAEFDIKIAVCKFFNSLACKEKWAIYWVAGNGSMSSSALQMHNETNLFSAFVAALKEFGREYSCNGVVFFASSAGAIYASSTDSTITEETVEAPNSSYGFEKLRQEHLLLECAINIGLPVLIGRISTLYGKMQSHTKQQGLLSHIANSIVRKSAVRIYVPLDTMRDYLYVVDAAEIIKTRMDVIRLNRESSIQIIASELSISIAQIIATFNKISKKRLMYHCSRTELSSLYRKCVMFKSIKYATDRRITPLPIAAHEILCYEELKYTSCNKIQF